MELTRCKLNTPTPYNRKCKRTICCIECELNEKCEEACDWYKGECQHMELL